MTHHVTPPRGYVLIYVALIVLTVATVSIAFLELPEWAHLWIGLAIATAKATLVVLFFMHVWYSTRLTWVVALSGLLWLTILLVYVLTDYLSRGWVGVPGR
jgi:cytochrome c oxidase subunit IV